jgi:choice-of-anchor B domain-containing protein
MHNLLKGITGYLAFLLIASVPAVFAHGDAETEKGDLTAGGGGTGGPFAAHNIRFLSQLTLAQLGAGAGVRGNDIWGWTDPLDGRDYALVGRSNGTAFVDVSDPANPVYLGTLPTATGNSAWRDIKVYADYAYIVSDGNGAHGMQVFDLTQLRSITTPPVTFAETSHYSGFTKAHNLAINEATGFAYASGTNTYSGGLHFIDITNPVLPVSAGGFAADGYTHDNQVVIYTGPDTAYRSREISFNANEDTLTIVDVTVKTAPVQLSRSGYSGSAYVHQGWLTEDQRYFLSNDELDEYYNPAINYTRTHMWNVTDLDAPVYMGYYQAQVQSIDHNLYTHRGLVYEANYTTGLRVLDYSDIANGSLTEVAWIDTHPAKDSLTAFDGAWSVYPYFASGIVVIGDRDEGLVVVKLIEADMAIIDVVAPATVVQYQSVDFNLSVRNNGPDAATDTVLAAVLPAGLTFVSAVAGQGVCTESSGTVTCTLGSLADGAATNVYLTATAGTPGMQTIAMTLTADEVDTLAVNNATAISIEVLQDSDGDGLSDDFESALGTDPYNPDSDGDDLTDGQEVNYDGDPDYTPGQDTDPNSPDTDADDISDSDDPLPLSFHYNDGDLAPFGVPDGLINAADLLICQRIVIGAIAATELELAHGDLHPSGTPNGVIDLPDCLLLQRILMQ